MTEFVSQLRPVAKQAPSGRPRQQRATITKGRILDAAARAFACNGYASTSLIDLCVASASTKGAIYFHFDSKEAIAQELVRYWSTALDHAYRAANESQQSAVDQVSSFYRDVVESVAVSSLVRAGLRLTAETGVEGAPEVFAHWVAITSTLVDSAVESGQLADNPMTRQLGWNLCAGLVGTVNIIRVVGDPGDFTARMHDLVTMHLVACATVDMC